MEKIDNVKTYGEAADFLNKCDADDTPVYIKVEDHVLPIDNYALFSECIKHDNDEHFPFYICEEDGLYFIGC